MPYAYTHDDFWLEYRNMLNEVIKKFDLINVDGVICKNNVHIKFKNYYGDLVVDGFMIYEIFVDNKQRIETFEMWYKYSNKTYVIEHDLKKYFNIMRCDLEKHIYLILQS